MSTSIIYIKKSALHKNIQFIREYIGDEIKISVVIKGNAYGHGIEKTIPVFEEAGINHFSVFSSEEARRAFKVTSENTRLMIMGYTDDDDLEWVLKNEVEFYIISIEKLSLAIEKAKNLNKKARIHLDIETGMQRTGLNLIQLKKALEIIKQNEAYIDFVGVATHLAGAESIANNVRIVQQLKTFQKRVKYIVDQGLNPLVKHTASSAATISYPRSRMDMVRIGIMAYGFWPTKETFIQYLHKNGHKEDTLERAIEWNSKIMSLKSIKEGDFIGYGYGYQAQQNMRIAIVPVGYSNGYSRLLSNNGHVLVRGQRADVIGTVNMNMVIINVSQIEDISVGDEVVLLGRQDKHEITVASFSEMNNSMNYELLARLPERIERILI
jgi:alanine racemase